MKKILFARKKQYLAIILVLVCTAVTTSAVYRDICINASDISRDKLSDSASLFAAYFNNTMKEKITSLEQLAGSIDEDTLEEEKKLKKLTNGYYRWFAEVSVLDCDGNLKSGSALTEDISETSVFSSVVYGKQTLIYENIVYEEGSDTPAILVCTPIQNGTKTIGVLEGIFYVSEMDDFLEEGEYSQKDCIFLMTEDGEYLASSSAFSSVMGENSYNFYKYLLNCEMHGDVTSVSTMESVVSKRQAASITYTRNGANYIGILTPTSYGNWYMGFVNDISYFSDAFTLPKTTEVLLIVTIVLWILWLLAFCRSIYTNGKISLELERYELLNERSNSLIFDFSFSPKKLRFFGDMKKVLGYEEHEMRGEEVYDVYQYIHKDDASVRSRIHQFYDDDETEFSAEVRIRKASGEYRWFRIVGLLIKDNPWNINRNFIGRIENVDQQLAKEKNLLERSENDLLTGILNKKTMEEKVRACLENILGSHHYVFFMVDLDNFKNVNDNLGHIIGDQAIIDTAEALKGVFQSNANIGRLGGDEFAVCVWYDAFDEESLYLFIRKKAEQICAANRRTYTNMEKEVHITSSVGIAIAPDFASDWETIYSMADSALYRSKNSGKDCWHIYEKGK